MTQDDIILRSSIIPAKALSPDKVTVTVPGGCIFRGYCPTHHSRPGRGPRDYWAQQASPSSWTTCGHPVPALQIGKLRPREGRTPPRFSSAPTTPAEPAHSLGHAQQTCAPGPAQLSRQIHLHGVQTFAWAENTSAHPHPFLQVPGANVGKLVSPVSLRDNERGPSGTATGSKCPPKAALALSCILSGLCVHLVWPACRPGDTLPPRGPSSCWPCSAQWIFTCP